MGARIKNYHVKMHLVLLLLALSTLLITACVLYSVSYDDTITTYKEKAEQVVNSILNSIDVGSLKKYQQTLVMDEHYYEKVKQMDKLVKKIGAKKVFIIATFDEKNYIYIYSSSEFGDGVENSIYDRKKLGDKGEQDDWSLEIFSGTENYKKSDTYKANSRWGHVCTAVAPIKDENGKVFAFIGLDYSLDEELQELNTLYIKFVLVYGVSYFLISIFFYLFFYKYFILPIRTLKSSMSHLVNKKYTKISKNKIKILSKNDDIAILVDVFNKMISDLKIYTENIKKISSEKEQISTELNIANHIQTSLIPQTFPAFPELNEIDIYANSKPAKRVGGDFYDFFLLDKEHLAFVIADVSGKGISAALFMVIARTLIRNNASIDKTPGEILNKVNKQMCLNNDLGMFLTLFFGILNFKTGELVFSNAGHLKPIYKFRDNKFKELNVKKNFVIAGVPTAKFKDEKIQMNPNDIIFMYTDGIVESLDKNNSQSVGINGLLNLLNSIDTSKCSLKYIIDLVQKDIDKFSNGKQFDDETMLIIKFKGHK